MIDNNDSSQTTLKDKWGNQRANIPGWGIDANPKNDPTFPMRQRFDEDRAGFTWQRPTQQPGYEKALHSNERPDVTRVFGTSAPASGLSGAVRRCAFKYSEGRFAHWALLLLADRINVVEGFATDLCHGRATQCVTDRGIKAKWQYDRNAVLAKGAVCAAVVGVLTMVCFRRHLLPQKRGMISAALMQHCRHLWRSRL